MARKMAEKKKKTRDSPRLGAFFLGPAEGDVDAGPHHLVQPGITNENEDDVEEK